MAEAVSRTEDRDAMTCVVGDDAVAVGLVDRLAERGSAVLVSPDTDVVAEAERRGIDARVTDVTDPWALEAAGAGDADTLVAAFTRDERNILLAQIARTRFETPRIVVRLADPELRDAFDDIGVETVCVTSVLAEELAGRVV
ncbi:NAD(P)-binding protein [Halostella salina]|uniref:NAD(P)-binding protein n=1 Tax=Halostella salina TaxID=1547897 RepID=UPI0013CEADEA|nr:NAD(P)-binding protein [Halostella salina]